MRKVASVVSGAEPRETWFFFFQNILSICCSPPKEVTDAYFKTMPKKMTTHYLPLLTPRMEDPAILIDGLQIASSWNLQQHCFPAP